MEGEAPLDAAERCLRDARNAGLAACVRSHPIEALIFGVLMPLAIGSYFVGDLVLDVSAYSGTWVQASCYIRALTFQERHVYHEGKYADARNALYERGWLFELQPAWNVTVTPSQSIGGALGGGARGASWDARLLAHVRYSQARRCEGHVGEDLARTVAQCTDGEHAGWISPVLEINGSVPCFAHSTNRTFTYLSVSEPFGFYLDGIAAAFCLVLGITVAYELIRGRPWEDTYETYESDRRPFSTAEALFAMH